MSKIVARARRVGEATPLAPDEIRRLFGEGDGGRVMALGFIAGRPTSDLIQVVREGIKNWVSAFEQYQALVAARSLAQSDLSRADRERLRTAIKEQMEPGPGKYITPGSDRWRLAEGVLELLQ